MLGVDVLSIRRVKAVYDKFGAKFATKILSPYEMGIFEAITHEGRRVEFLAGRFCAKEAIYKVNNYDGNGHKLTWNRVQLIGNKEGGGLKVELDGVGMSNIKASLSHEKDMVVAIAMRMNF